MPELLGACEIRNYPRDHEEARRAGDYAYARTRTKLPKRDTHSERGYDVASHFAKEIAARRRDKGRALGQLFHEEVGRWKNATGHLSSITKAIAHPSYLRVIGLARNSTSHEIERLLLRELESEPDHWFAALSAVTGEDPVKPEYDFDEAVEAWLAWGREKGII